LSIDGIELGRIKEILMYKILNSTFAKKILLSIVDERAFLVLINDCWHILELARDKTESDLNIRPSSDPTQS
jgi:hypothetical protein